MSTALSFSKVTNTPQLPTHRPQTLFTTLVVAIARTPLPTLVTNAIISNHQMQQSCRAHANLPFKHRAALNQLPLKQIVQIIVCDTLMPLEGTRELWINKKV
jgi:hypothetical protein